MKNILSEEENRTIEDIIISILGVRRDQLTEDARIVEDLNADSLDVAEIVLAFEEQFGILMPDSRVDEVKTIRDARETVAELLHAPRPS